MGASCEDQVNVLLKCPVRLDVYTNQSGRLLISPTYISLQMNELDCILERVLRGFEVDQ